MADKPIGELPRATEVTPQDLLVEEQNGVAKAVPGQVLINMLVAYADGHGGIADWRYAPAVAPSLEATLTLVLADESEVSVPILNGDKGDKGDADHLWIKYAPVRPTKNSDMSDAVNAWIGICVSTASTAPTSYTSYAWYEFKGDKGDRGDSLANLVKISGPSSPGSTDIYRAVLDSGESAGTIEVYNGLNGEGSPGDATPKMDGTATPGTSTDFARVDHVHPENTRKADVSDHRLRTYTDVSQLGLSSGASIAQAWNALTVGSLLVADAAQFVGSALPEAAGTVEICKANTGWILFHGADDYRQAITGSTPSGTWEQVATAERVNAADPGGAWGVEAEKFGGGLMICTGFLRFQGNTGQQSLAISFAETFISVPLGVSASIDGGGAGDTSPTVGTVIPSATGINVYANTNTSSGNYVLRYIAIGRWK